MENLSDYNFSSTEQVLLINNGDDVISIVYSIVLINNGDDVISIVYSIVCYYLRFTNFMYNLNK